MKDKFLSMLPIETKRLVIKKTTKDDISLIMKMDKQEETQKYLGGIKNKSLEERLEFLDKKDKNNNSLTVVYNDIKIGFIGLKIEEEKAEVSYIFDYDYVNNGFCSEALSKLICISFNELNLDVLYAYSKKDNLSSIKVLEKNGFKESGTKEDFIYYELRKEV